MSVGRSLVAVVTPPGYGTVGYWQVVGGRYRGRVRVRVVGWTAVLIECGTPERVWAVLAQARDRRARGELAATEIVAGAATVLLDGVPDPVALAREVARWPAAGTGPRAAPQPAGVGDDGPELTVPTRYDGPDLDLVARYWGTSAHGVARRHSGTRFRVAFCGFAPGFGYLTGLPADLAVPRLDQPRARVPAGSVALAGAYTGVYPSASPGGWLLIGRTDLALFDPAADPPARLRPGLAVRFVPVGPA